MKSLEMIMVQNLKTRTGNILLNLPASKVSARKMHLDEQKTHAFSSSSELNTIQPDLLLSKMIQLEFNPNLFHVLANGIQLVWSILYFPPPIRSYSVYPIAKLRAAKKDLYPEIRMCSVKSS